MLFRASQVQWQPLEAQHKYTVEPICRTIASPVVFLPIDCRGKGRRGSDLASSSRIDSSDEWATPRSTRGEMNRSKCNNPFGSQNLNHA